MKFVDITGQTFSHWTVLERISGRRSPNGRTSMHWKCRCRCGAIGEVSTNNLRRGRSMSCGCVRKPRPKSAIRKKYQSRPATTEYRIWSAMKDRCRNPRASAYHRYGGRGIAVCERWSVFKNFLADMGPRPSRLHSIDRYPDNNGNYEPDNCRWATQREQLLNTSRTVKVVIDGESVSVNLIAEKTGQKANTVYSRLRRGWSVEQAISGKR